MNAPLAKLDQETIVVKDFALHVHVIGLGAIGEVVLTNIRAHYGRYPYGGLVEEKSETEQINELIFLVTGSDVASEVDITCQAGSLVNKATGSTLIFTFSDHASEKPSEKLLEMARHTISEQIDAHIVITSDRASDAKAYGKIIFERISSIISAIATPGSINVDFADFCHAMTGARKNACASIKPAWGEAQGPDRAILATTQALAAPAFRQHLSQADGMLIEITGNPKYLMGREVKLIGKEMRKHVSERCIWLGSICYDEDMPPDILKVEIFASR